MPAAALAADADRRMERLRSLVSALALLFVLAAVPVLLVGSFVLVRALLAIGWVFGLVPSWLVGWFPAW